MRLTQMAPAETPLRLNSALVGIHEKAPKQYRGGCYVYSFSIQMVDTLMSLYRSRGYLLQHLRQQLRSIQSSVARAGHVMGI